jgi:hypothetical protein
MNVKFWYILWPFGIVCGLLLYFFMFGPRKIWQPWWARAWTLASCYWLGFCGLENFTKQVWLKSLYLRLGLY